MKRYITAAILILTVFACTAGADDWQVHSGDSIQSAINSAAGGDTIYVWNGTYSENVIVNKTLTLRGESRETTIIDGGGTGRVVNITADDVAFTGFTVQNSGDSYNSVGIILFSSDNIILSDNIIRDNRDGVKMWGGSNSNTVANSTVESNIYDGISCSSKNIITNNTVSDNMYGISIHSTAPDNIVLNNSISNNEYGIFMTYSGGNNTLRGNTFEDNDCGINVFESVESNYNHSIDASNIINGKPVCYLYGVCDLVISGMDIAHLTVAAGTNVTIENNIVEGGDGIHLGFVSGSAVLNNTVSNNHHGISFGYSSDENEIIDNLFSNCIEDGIFINDARDNIFINNTISNNSRHGIYSTNHEPNLFINNTISNNSENGVHFFISDDSIFINNTISENDNGIYLRTSVNNTFTNNTISNNNEGIALSGWSFTYASRYNKFHRNNVSHNSHQGIYATKYSDHNIFTGNNASKNGWYGVRLLSSSNNTLTNNNASKNGYGGIYLASSSNDNNLTGNTVSENNGYGIYLQYSDGNNLTANTASGNNGYGIYLQSAENSSLSGNTISGNSYNFGVGGSLLPHFIHCTDKTNTVDGRPICYWVDRQDDQVPDGVGFVGIVNSTNITVNNVTLANNSVGILFAYTNDSRIEEATILDNCEDGIDLVNSNNNTITGSDVSGNDEFGVFLSYSNENDLTGNIINSNQWDGIYLRSSSSNTLTGNTVMNNDRGIGMESSSYNLIYNNYLNNTPNAYDDGTNIWNTTNTTGPNIIGGPFIGGNYWSDYEGDDTDGDGFGEAAHNIAGGLNQDHLPLVMSMCGDITGDGTIDTVDLLLLLEYVVTGTPIDACIADIDGNGRINVLDARLLMGYINNPTRYSLHCGC